MNATNMSLDPSPFLAAMGALSNAWPFSLAGFVVGLIVGLTGVGGGSLMTPILIFGFGVKAHLAVGTDLLFAAATKGFGSWGLAKSRSIDWPIVALLSAGSIPAALGTVWVLHTLGPANAATHAVMTTTLGAALLLTAAATLYKAAKGGKGARQLAQRAHASTSAASGSDPAKTKHEALPVLLGALIGALVAITSVGAGAVGVSVLMLLYPALPLPRIVAADIAYAVPLTLVAGLGHASLGSVDWSLLAALLAGSLPGIWLGSKLIHKAPDRILRALLSLLLAYAGIKLIAL